MGLLKLPLANVLAAPLMKGKRRPGWPDPGKRSRALEIVVYQRSGTAWTKQSDQSTPSADIVLALEEVRQGYWTQKLMTNGVAWPTATQMAAEMES